MDENETKIALSESWSGWGPAGNTHSTLISEGNNVGLKKGTWSGFVDQMLWAYHSYLACIIYFSPSSQEPFALLLRTQAHSGQCWGWGEGSCQGSWHSKHCRTSLCPPRASGISAKGWISQVTALGCALWKGLETSEKLLQAILLLWLHFSLWGLVLRAAEE